ncbi:hypothetical protein BKA70DRAFT_1234978 [Coprinopsis sp. MPI-PUGE-AT-0042]|nr:hypothetical protein BKA70DRAFT_1234978 [Coprinopsis sp. MPI-PUGE-AT-0042]
MLAYTTFGDIDLDVTRHGWQGSEAYFNSLVRAEETKGRGRAKQTLPLMDMLAASPLTRHWKLFGTSWEENELGRKDITFERFNPFNQGFRRNGLEEEEMYRRSWRYYHAYVLDVKGLLVGGGSLEVHYVGERLRQDLECRKAKSIRMMRPTLRPPQPLKFLALTTADSTWIGRGNEKIDGEIEAETSDYAQRLHYVCLEALALSKVAEKMRGMYLVMEDPTFRLSI